MCALLDDAIYIAKKFLQKGDGSTLVTNFKVFENKINEELTVHYNFS